MIVPKIQNKMIPVVRDLPADLETTVSVYLKLAGEGPSFLLESVTGGEQVARYSFIGVDVQTAWVLRGDAWERHAADGSRQRYPLAGRSPMRALQDLWQPLPSPAVPDLPRFVGGLVGYLGYETVRYLEPTVALTPDDALPEAVFLEPSAVVAFDHARDRLLMIALAAEEDALLAAEARLDALQARLQQPLPALPVSEGASAGPLQAHTTRRDFLSAVETARAHIAAGDIFQVVLSQRFSRRTAAHPFAVYRALRRINPSPYMFYFDFGNLAGERPFRLLGASPEMHVRLEEGIVSLRPIAGTRPRGATPDEDLQREGDLLADPKERAEHVMLLDLGRNDLGRVCRYGTVHVPEQMVVERYSHVMHLVSLVQGELRPGLTAADLLEATFPAGTVSGAPKVRAMQIIRDLEPHPRGPYAGAVGYLSVNGNADTCLAIRTLWMLGDTVHVQAGAGVVADSTPEGEYNETLHKAQALLAAVELAEKE